MKQEIVGQIIAGIILIGIGYISRNIWKIMDHVSSIPKIKEDMNLLYKRLRAVENELRDMKNER
jgi:hypothetical protein